MKFEEAIKVLNKWRNRCYNSPNNEEVELYKAIEIIFNYYKEQEALDSLADIQEQQAHCEMLAKIEKQDKLLVLYKTFYNSLKPTIEYEEEYNEEYLDIGGVTSETIEIVKQIKELEE